jgi:hypothetical protein
MAVFCDTRIHTNFRTISILPQESSEPEIDIPRDTSASQQFVEQIAPAVRNEDSVCVDTQGNIIARWRYDMRELEGWLALAESSFDFWDNEEDAVYDNL